MSGVAEIFDPLGKMTPIVCCLELDISELSTRKLDWDDVIPDDLCKIWRTNFVIIDEISRVRFNRAIVPDDSVDLFVETIDTGDASSKLICAAVYVRFRRKNNTYPCHLVFARSKVVPRDTSMPRAELMAALLNASSGHCVKLAFGAYHTKCWKLTDSQVVLHWINSKKSALKMWVRYRVIEINRLTDVDKWHYVDSKNMIADIGARKGAKMSVRSDSNWICGLTWMEGGECEFPIKTLKEIVLDNNEVGDLNKESIIKENWGLTCKIVSDEYKNRYDFSEYLIDPNRFRFKKVVRVMALVYLFVLKFMSKYG